MDRVPGALSCERGWTERAGAAVSVETGSSYWRAATAITNVVPDRSSNQTSPTESREIGYATGMISEIHENVSADSFTKKDKLTDAG